MQEEEKQIRPQEWFQVNFLSSEADIVIGGGKAWSWKSYALLLEPLRHINSVKGFWWVIFRRTSPQITNEWWLRDTSDTIYPYAVLEPRRSELRWIAKNGNKIKFSHLEHEDDKNSRQWAQIPYIGFDELTHFTESQFRYLVGRSRSTCGVKPYVRATCNPDPDSWVKNLIDRRIDPETWYIIKGRDGVLRYFIRLNNQMVRGDSVEEVVEKAPHVFWSDAMKSFDPKELVLSITFIEGDIYDNKELMRSNPSYLANLMAQDEQTRSQLLDGNWHIKVDDNSLGNYAAISDIFSNFIQASDEKVITTDVARYGRDLTVVGSRRGWYCDRIDIRTKSATTKTTSVIEERRAEYGVGKSQVLVDQDGIGGWVVDEWEYIWFSWGKPVQEDKRTKEKENYANLKTQCYYRLFEENVNKRLIRINAENIRVDGVRTNTITINGKTYDVKDLIMKNLRAIKRSKIDKEGKLQINTKEEQKIVLAGMSPDFADMIMMRKYFDLNPNADRSDFDFYTKGGW